ESAEFGGLKPFGRVVAGDHIPFYAEGGKEETVNDILGGEIQFDSPAEWDVEFIDFAVAFGVLSLPHPLFADDINFEGVGWRSLLVEIKIGAPSVEADHHDQRNGDPGNFDHGLRQTGFAAIGSFATAIFEEEIDDWQNYEQDHRAAERNEREVKVIDLMRKVGALRWKDWEVHEGTPVSEI